MGGAVPLEPEKKMAYLTACEVLEAGLTYTIAGPGGALAVTKHEGRYAGEFFVYGETKGEADCDSIESILNWIELHGRKCLTQPTLN